MGSVAEDIVCFDGIWRPAYDRHAVNAILGHARRDIPKLMKYAPPDRRRLCVQAGGNVGIWPQRLANDFARVVTFEVDELNWRCLEKNVTAENVEAYPFGLWSEEGECATVVPRLEEKNCGAVQVVPGIGARRLVPLDSYSFAAPVDFLILDVEGAELPALKGAEKTIAKDKPVIVLELKRLGKHYGYTDEELIDWLCNRHYHMVACISRDKVFEPC